jgi:hypothetical protein
VCLPYRRVCLPYRRVCLPYRRVRLPYRGRPELINYCFIGALRGALKAGSSGGRDGLDRYATGMRPACEGRDAS